VTATAVSLPDLAAEFPVLRRDFDGHPLTYLDSSATSQTPQPVIDAMTRYYTHSRASIHRGVYPLAVEATDLYEGARRRPRRRSSPPTPPPRSTWSPTPGAART
jgi:cysteine desulfurase / selenocysteine lyase